MRVFLDTNVFIAAVADEATHGASAVEILDSEHELVNSLLNVMELRAVLTKKHAVEAKRAREIEDEVRSGIEVVVPDSEDVLDANELQQETLLYPMDCLILACAEGCGATLVSFDNELVENRAIEPADVVS
ncbi:type II toxin-antitoxin system VapC family toxin [Salarchaeum japonicum]|uniref:type II toxin-antitoxin system VapC family toxin n=1 Tax=Salarchaeum japonicum TaxID=555573 RepID=UPI003C737A2C